MKFGNKWKVPLTVIKGKEKEKEKEREYYLAFLKEICQERALTKAFVLKNEKDKELFDFLEKGIPRFECLFRCFENCAYFSFYCGYS